MFKRSLIYLCLGLCCSTAALAQTKPTNAVLSPNTIVIKNHQFEPLQLTVPSGQKIQLIVDNQDPTAEEFESFDLDREQVVGGRHQITVFIGPLKPGTYKYWGDYHEDTTKGTIIAQ